MTSFFDLFRRRNTMVTRRSFIPSLKRAKDVNSHYEFIDSCARVGDLDTLRHLFARILEECPFGPTHWAPRAVTERIIEAVALNDGYDNAIATVELAKLANQRVESRHIRPAAVISKIVAAQSGAVIDKLLSTVSDLEAKAILLHEAVMRKKVLTNSEAATRSAALLASHRHPLAFLPLTLFDFEDELSLPSYQLGSAGWGMPFGPHGSEQTREVASAEAEFAFTEKTTTERATRIASAIKNWAEESNGKFEARTFHVDAPESLILEPAIRNLGLECVGPSDALAFPEKQSLKEVFAVLFAAASTGGAYNSGEFAGYGRLSAWRSLGGLVGCGETAAINDVARVAGDCEWLLFSTSNDWYYQVAWDIGIACWNPSLRDLTILAATDTD